MAKALTKTVQEPEDSLVMAKSVEGKTGRIFILTKLHSTVKIGDTETKMSQPKEHIVGFMPVFDDWEKALEWAGGDASLIQIGETR